jgi:hypothetical protein
MQPNARRIVENLDEPEALEALYRQDPESFRAALSEASDEIPDSTILRVWRARIEYRESAVRVRDRRLWYAIAIGLGVGALIRIPAIWLGEEWYYPRLAPSLVILGLAAYFWLQSLDRRMLIAGLTLAVVAAGFVSLLPSPAADGTATQIRYPDSVVMALIHLPILFWAFLGWVFTGASWRNAEPRVRFIRYNGELLMLASLVGLGGMVFSGITVALFQLLRENSAEWYFQNVGIVGAAAVPLAGTYLYDVVFSRRTGIASVLARIFAPLFLIMTSAYLAAALVGGQNPFVDRSFLITVNGLLLVVLAMTVLSIAERADQARVAWIDYINVALLVVTLVIDLIALSAIVFRLGSYGFTPNRIVVLGANVVVLAHLAWTCRAYAVLVHAKTDAAGIQRAVAGYLPVYAGWAALVVFVLPFVFGFA